MKKLKYLAGAAVVLALSLFLIGCAAEFASIPVGAPDEMADIDYNAVYFDGSLYSYWMWNPVGFWVFSQTAYLPPAYRGRYIHHGHYPSHWGHSGYRHGGIHRSGGIYRGGGIHRGGGIRRGGGGIYRGGGGIHGVVEEFTGGKNLNATKHKFPRLSYGLGNLNCA